MKSEYGVEMVMKQKKSIGLRIILGIAGIATGFIIQVFGAYVIKVLGLEGFVIFRTFSVILGFIAMGYFIYQWALK